MSYDRLTDVVRCVTAPGRTADGIRIDLEDVESGSGKLRDTPRKREGAGLLVEADDVLFAKLRPNLRKSLRVVAPGACSPEFLVLRPGPGLESRYLAYVVQGQGFVDAAVSSADGVKMPRTSFEKLRSTRIVVPALDDQVAIADFLDAETARIDALVTAQQRMTALIEERWAALRHRITGSGALRQKGQSIALRHIARLQAGAAFPHDRQGDVDGTLPYVKVGDLGNVGDGDRLRGAANRVTPAVAAELRSPILPADTIVLPKIGAALLGNRRAVLSEPSCLDQNVMGVTVHVGNPRFVHYCLASIDFGALSTPGPVPLLNETAASSIRIPWPSVGAQDAAVEALDAHRSKARSLIALVGRQIALLGERRRALIAAAVDGRLPVAGADLERSAA